MAPRTQLRLLQAVTVVLVLAFFGSLAWLHHEYRDLRIDDTVVAQQP